MLSVFILCVFELAGPESSADVSFIHPDTTNMTTDSAFQPRLLVIWYMTIKANIYRIPAHKIVFQKYKYGCEIWISYTDETSFTTRANILVILW